MALGSATTPISNAANNGNGNGSSHINLSTPAGWSLLYFFVSVAVLSILFFTV